MTIITISRGSYSHGKEIAEKLAEKLGYKCIGRRLILEASSEFNIPEIKLRRALHDSPTIFDRFTFGKEKYIAFVRKTILQHLQEDNVVYHGLAGHFFLKDTPHVLKVRIIADFEDRVKEEMKREAATEKEARYIIAKDDDERRKWSLHLYGVDTWDPILYDLVIHVGNLTVDDATDLIISAAGKDCFQKTPESQKVFDELFLAAKVQAILIERFPTVDVSCKDETLYISCKGSLGQEEILKNKVRDMLQEIPNIDKIRFAISPVLTPD